MGTKKTPYSQTKLKGEETREPHQLYKLHTNRKKPGMARIYPKSATRILRRITIVQDESLRVVQVCKVLPPEVREKIKLGFGNC